MLCQFSDLLLGHADVVQPLNADLEAGAVQQGLFDVIAGLIAEQAVHPDAELVFGLCQELLLAVQSPAQQPVGILHGDDAACHHAAGALVAAEIAPTVLVFCFEKAGVLRDPDDDTSLIREITAATYPPLKADGVVSKGMIPKIENALKAVEKGERSVTIRSSENLSTGIGTVIRNS